MITSREPFRKYTDSETFEKIVKYPSMTKMWQSCVSQYKDRVAIEDNGISYTYEMLESDASVMRAELIRRGVKRGERVGIFIPSSYAFARAYIAVTTIGAVAVLMPAQLDEKTVYGCTLKFRMKHIIYSEALSEKTQLSKNMGVDLISAEASYEGVGTAEMTDTEPSEPCSIVFTGGTTGQSKGALLSHGAMMSGVTNGCYGMREVFDQRYFLVLPLTHVFGLIRNFLTCLYTGSVLYICRNPKNMFKEMGAFKPSVLILVPALAELALNLSKQFGAQLLGGNIKYIICGASAVAPFLIEDFAKMGVTLLAGYGLTESANLVSGNPESLRKPSSVGIPYPDQELKLVNGELWLKGENMLDCYDGDEQATKEAFEDGWFKTGDLVKIDEEGYLYIVGRLKEVIVLSSGENVSPAELETKFLSAGCLSDAMVYEDFTEGGRQILTLEVVPRPGATLSEDEIIEAMREINKALNPYERVNKIVVRKTDFERTPAMKKIRIKKNEQR